MQIGLLFVQRSESVLLGVVRDQALTSLPGEGIVLMCDKQGCAVHSTVGSQRRQRSGGWMAAGRETELKETFFQDDLVLASLWVEEEELSRGWEL